MTRPDLRLDLHVSEVSVESVRNHNSKAGLPSSRAIATTVSGAFSESPV